MFNLKQAWDTGYLSASMSYVLMIPHNRKLLKCCLCCCIGLLKCRPLPPRAVVLVDCAKCPLLSPAALISYSKNDWLPRVLPWYPHATYSIRVSIIFHSFPWLSATRIWYVWSNIDHVITLSQSTWIIWTRQENAFLLLPLLLL